MRSRSRSGAAAGVLALMLAPASASAQQSLEALPEAARLDVSEEHATARLGEPNPHWVYVLDPVFPHLIAAKVWLIDGGHAHL